MSSEDQQVERGGAIMFLVLAGPGTKLPTNQPAKTVTGLPVRLSVQNQIEMKSQTAAEQF